MNKETVLELIRLLVESRLQEVAGPLTVKDESETHDDYVYTLDMTEVFREYPLEYMMEQMEVFKALMLEMGFEVSDKLGTLYIYPTKEITHLFNAIGYMLIQKGVRVTMICEAGNNPNHRRYCSQCGMRGALGDEDKIIGKCRRCGHEGTMVQMLDHTNSSWFTTKD